MIFNRIISIVSLLFLTSVPHLCKGQVVVDDTVKVLTYHIKGRTATGTSTYKIKQPFLAISRDLLEKYPLGSTVRLFDCEWEGTYAVLDIMGNRHVKTVDIFKKKAKKKHKNCRCTMSAW